MSDIHQIYERILEITKHNSMTDTRLENLDQKITMSTESSQEVKTLLQELNVRLERISESDHIEHHAYVETLLKKQQNREKLIAAITNELAKKGTIASLIFLLTIFWAGATDSLSEFIAKLKQ